MRWQRRSFTATGLTQAPPGPHIDKLARHSIGTIKVTAPYFDNIGEVLSAMGVSYEPFDHNYDCDLLFMNCGSEDRLDPTAVRHFVEGGGCLYASDQQYVGIGYVHGKADRIKWLSVLHSICTAILCASRFCLYPRRQYRRGIQYVGRQFIV